MFSAINGMFGSAEKTPASTLMCIGKQKAVRDCDGFHAVRRMTSGDQKDEKQENRLNGGKFLHCCPPMTREPII